MISEEKLPELFRYKIFESAIPFAENFNYSNLVSPNGNAELPIHRWFKFKESFAAGLLDTIVKSLELKEKFTLLDPFCGVGTSLIAAQELTKSGFDIDAIGIETNPFTAFAARTKVRWREVDNSTLLTIGNKLLKRANKLSPPIPSLSSLSKGKCITRYMSQRILAVRQAIEMDGNSITHNALLLGLAAAIEPVSRIRKDGRALRIVDRPQKHLAGILRDKWSKIASDVSSMRGNLFSAKTPKVILGDGRRPCSSGVLPDSIDLILTSPPYPNNIDYFEVYKLELWLLGFVNDLDVYREVRSATFQSHPRCKDAPPADFLQEVQNGTLKDILAPILERLSSNTKPWRRRLLLGYFGDMWTALHEQYRCLRQGGHAVLVVGNSLHGTFDCPYVIPTDIVTSLIGQAAGFETQEIIVARPSKRRLSGNHFLRESLVILRKPYA
jgi:DNA modification methylase